MILREYRKTDAKTVARLFYETVHTVNVKDYTAAQLAAWANSTESLLSRAEELSAQRTLLAEIDGGTVGFASIDAKCCLDMLFVHKDFQRRGIGTALCDALENGCSVVTTFASVTAKPFFEKRGYTVVKEQQVVRNGVTLRNFEMIKQMKNR